MTTAKTLLLDLLAVIPDGGRSATFFAEDGVMELPFLHAIGIPWSRAASEQPFASRDTHNCFVVR